MKILSVFFVALVCSACGNYNAPTQMPPQAGNVPLIVSIAPNSMKAGSAAFTLTVNGSNFNTNAVVNWAGTPQTTMYVTGKQLTAAIPASAVATAGTVAVTVTNPGSSTPGGPYGGGMNIMSETSASMMFTVQ